MRRFARLALFAVAASGVSSCSAFQTNVQDTQIEQKETAKANYDAAEAAFTAAKWVEAVKYFDLVKNKYPYSKYAVLSELRLADTQFVREKWLEAADAYRIFVRFHPRHEQVAYATFRVALSHSRAVENNVAWLPFVDAKEKDQAAAKDTIRACDEYITRFPDDEHVKEAKALRSVARGRLADVDLYAAGFYAERSKWQGALWRYQKVGDDYADTAQASWALLQAGLIAENELQDAPQARRLYEKLVREHPDAKEAGDAKAALQRLATQDSAKTPTTETPSSETPSSSAPAKG